MTRRPFGLFGLSLLVLAVALLVAGVLGWVTTSALKVEDDQRTAAARAERGEKERLAFWRLDGRVFPALGLEGYRKYEHFTALYAPPADPPGGPQYLSPLVSIELPEWMPLHFQFDPATGWTSPQVLPLGTVNRLANPTNDLDLSNLTDERRKLLDELNRRFPVKMTAEALKDLDADASDSSAVVVVAVVPQRSSELSLNREEANKADWGQSLSPETPAPATMPSPGPAAIKSQAQGGGARSGVNPASPYVGNTAVGQMAQAGGRGQAEIANPDEKNKRQIFNDNRTREILGGIGNAQRVVPAELEKDRVVPPAPEGLKKGKDKAENQSADRAVPTPATPSSGSFDSAKKVSEPPAGVAGGRGGPGGGDSAAAPKSANPTGPSPTPAMTSPGGPPAAFRRAEAPTAAPKVTKPDGEEKGDAVKEMQKRATAGEALAKAGDDGASKRQFHFGAMKKDEDPLAVKKPAPPAPPVAVNLGPMRPKWLTDTDGKRELVVVRPARLEGKTVYQGVLLDWEKLRELLKEEVKDDFPNADLAPSDGPADAPQHQLSALPVRFDSGPAPVLPPAGWTPLRLGLSLAWLAAAVALIAVWFGGWSLVDLSERRIRFVSAVTHELRTPLTSLRLYLDMLTNGMVTDEVQKQQYLTTLSHESNRLNQLIENVLDFAKLEKRAGAVAKQPVPVAELLDHARETWHDRLAADGKEFVIISTVKPEQFVTADPRIAQQILGNLIDNARKYSLGAADARIWLWVKPAGRRVAFEVEDRGPGIPLAERSSIFRPFRRGGTSGATGGAGLGLALARQWAESLGGRLSYRPADGGTGACFRLELPATA